MKDIKYMTMAILAAAALAAGCAQENSESDTQRSKEVFDAWVSVQKEKHPEYLWRKTPLGCYVLEETIGTGETVGDSEKTPYISVNYTVTDRDGNITDSNTEESAKLLDTWSRTAYYGPSIAYRGENSMYAGIEQFLPDMKVGGKAKVLIPGWLMTSKRYSKEETYIRKVTSGTTSIYEMEIADAISDIDKWMLDSLGRYVSGHFAKVDTLEVGCYYECLSEGTADLSSGSQYYISYTGRRMDGQAFDTTDKNLAIDERIYNSSKTYGETYITWNSDYKEITMGADASDLIDGFRLALCHMKLGERGRVLISPALGYAAKAKGKLIPAYSPLLFEIQIVKEK